MAVIGADGLTFQVGDGGSPTEIFTALKGAAVSRLEISQRNNPSPAIASDAWQVNAGASTRKAVLEGDAYATDEAPHLRLRTLALNGASGNFKLKLSSSETMQLAAIVTLYREVIEAGDIKKIEFRLESSGAVSIS